MQRIVSIVAVAAISIGAQAADGKKVFETWCWGCHHQTAVAFGPPFAEIAAKRDAATIRAMITDPEAVAKQLGYTRNAMPQLKLKEEELQAITDYILSFKPSKKPETNTTQENH